MRTERGRAIPLLFVLLSGAVMTIAPRGRAHEPITTKVMFNKEVIRILQTHCLSCHSPGHIRADIPLTTYREARPWAKAIKEEVLERRMMPFQAVKGYGRFRHSYALPQRDQELLISWIEGGAPKGEEADYPREEIRALAKGGNWPAGEPDLVLQPAAAATLPADGGRVSRCEVLPVGNSGEKMVGRIDFLPGNAAIVERADWSLAPAGVKSPCSAPEGRFEWIGSWVPGEVAEAHPEGFARRLPAGSRIVLRIGYRGNGEASTDRSRLGLHYIEKPVSGRVETLSLKPPTTLLPAGTESHRVVATATISEDREALAIRPLPFPYARSIEAAVARPDGSTEVLVVTRGYRFPWQPTYHFSRPVALPRGSVITVTSYLDNSESNRSLADEPIRVRRFAAPLCLLVTGLPAPR